MTGIKEKSSVQLTDQQRDAIAFVEENISCGLVALSGPAGSGKTTLLKELRERLQSYNMVTVCALTNKAAAVLRQKGIEDCLTFHQVCMRPIFGAPLDKLSDYLNIADVEPDNKLIECPDDLFIKYGQDKLNAALDTVRRAGLCSALRQLGITDIFSYLEGWLPAGAKAGVLLIDEASMLGEEELNKAQSVFRKIVLIGDEYQLPPVKSAPVFWDVPTRYALTEIHRQAEGSQPLTLATKIRVGESVSPTPRVKIDPELCRNGVPVIVWKNATRLKLTDKVREDLGYKGLSPQEGEYLICRNGADRKAKNRGLINNTIWQVTKASGFVCDLINDMGEELLGEHVFMEELNKGDGTPFRFGYLITGHQSQGSEWPTVQIWVPDAVDFFRFKKDEASKWLYTAITRARDTVIWVQ